MTLRDAEALPSRIFRTHKGYIVNLSDHEIETG
ncbi:MAG: hypothetical protein ACLUIQ_02875 [Dialister invisus]